MFILAVAIGGDLTTQSRAGATSSVVPVTLQGEGTADVAAELTSWQNDVSTDSGENVNLDYGDGLGEEHGKADFLAGEDNYVISGVPFTSSELSEMSNGAGVIAAPIMPSGLAFLFSPPIGGFQVVKTDENGDVSLKTYGPSDGNEIPVVPGQVLTGCPDVGCPPVNVPTLNLAAMLQGDGQQVDSEPLDYWGRPEVLATWDQSVLDYEPSNGDEFNPQPNVGEPVTLLRQDPDDSTYWLQEYFSQQVPSEWDFSAPITESLPATLAGDDPTELGLTGEIQAFEKDEDPKTGSLPAGGVIAVAPPSGANLVDQDETTQSEEVHEGGGSTSAPLYPYAVPEFIQLQNANGDWTSPTPSAIEAGIDAGAEAGESACGAANENALYASTTAVPGAYPLSWVDCLYAPTNGLTISQSDALAGVVRYLVTTGQSYLEPDGDGALPASYVAQALSAANAIVADNCPGAGGVLVVTSRPTSWSTVSTGVTSLGAVEQCEPPLVAGTPTTSAPPVITSPVSSDSSDSVNPYVGSNYAATVDDGDGSGAEDTGASPTTPAVAEPPTTSLPKSRQAKRVITASIAANLPEPLTTAFDSGFDKLSALLIGGLLFLAGRKIIRWILKVGR